MPENLDKKTYLIHGGRDPLQQQGMVNPPIYQSSTLRFPSLKEYHQAREGKAHYPLTQNGHTLDYSYGIYGTPTTFQLQEALRTLEGGDACVIVPSGMAAIALALQALLSSGDHVLMVDNAYHPSHQFCEKELKRFGIATSYYDPTNIPALAAAIQPNTRVIFMESPGSQTFEMTDIEAVTRLAKQHHITTIFDNSWASPLYCNPIKHGVDVVLQALTKFIGGHGDVVLGAIITKGAEVSQAVLRTVKNHGVATSPLECAQALRGLRTMAARMESQLPVCLRIVQQVKHHPAVKQVIFPADPDDKNYPLWQKYYTGAASLFSVILKQKFSREDIWRITAERSELFGFGSSWGGYESLVMDFEPHLIRKVTPWQNVGVCLRFYIGLESEAALTANILDILDGFA